MEKIILTIKYVFRLCIVTIIVYLNTQKVLRTYEVLYQHQTRSIDKLQRHISLLYQSSILNPYNKTANSISKVNKHEVNTVVAFELGI